MKRVLIIIICVLLSLGSVFAVTQYFFLSEINYKNSIINVFIFFMVLALSIKQRGGLFPDRRKPDRSAIVKYAWIFSIVLAVVLIYGDSIYRYSTFDLVNYDSTYVLISIIKAIGFSHLFSIVLIPVFTRLRDFHASEGRLKSAYFDVDILKKDHWFFGEKRRSIFIVWGVIFICWLPVWLAYYPGIFSYDAVSHFLQSTGAMPLSNQHAVVYTLFVKFCFGLGGRFGGYATGLVVYSLIQMLFLSFVFSFALWRLAKIRLHILFRLVILIAFALNPVSSVFSFTLARDVPFAGFFVLLTVLIAEMLLDPRGFFAGRKRLVSMAVLILLLCLLRNNALPALLLFGIVVFLMYKKDWRRVLFVFGSGLIAAGLITGPLYSSLGVVPVPLRETLSVPANQIAIVYVKHGDELAPDDKAEIDHLFSGNTFKNFNPRLADPVKGTLVFDEKYGLKDFLGLWFKLSKEYPTDYAIAALSLNLAYWYPDTKQPDDYSLRGYIETEILSEPDLASAGFQVERSSKIPLLYSVCEQLVSDVKQQQIPVIGFLYNIGAPIWIVFFCVLLCFVKRKGYMALLCLPAVMLWLTLLAGPVANLRYIYPVILCLPIYLAIIASMKAREP